MTPLLLLLIALSVASLVTGQLLVKKAMNATHSRPLPWRTILPWFLAGLGALCVWFLLWLALLRNVDLSYLFPFESLSAIFLTLGAAWFLREKITWRLILGMALILLGVAFVARS